MLKLIFLPSDVFDSLQKDDVNKESLLDIILQGMPWSLTISHKNTYAIASVVKVVQTSEKCQLSP